MLGRLLALTPLGEQVRITVMRVDVIRPKTERVLEVLGGPVGAPASDE